MNPCSRGEHISRTTCCKVGLAGLYHKKYCSLTLSRNFRSCSFPAHANVLVIWRPTKSNHSWCAAVTQIRALEVATLRPFWPLAFLQGKGTSWVAPAVSLFYLLVLCGPWRARCLWCIQAMCRFLTCSFCSVHLSLDFAGSDGCGTRYLGGKRSWNLSSGWGGETQDRED